MKSNKHTLVIDGTNFLFRTLFVLPRRSKSGKFLDDPEDQGFFIRKLITDFSYQVRLFNGLVNQIVWTKDSKSWRKEYFPEAEYKGNRESKQDINWEVFFELTEKFTNEIERLGVIVSRVNLAEADDLMYAWNKKLRNNNTPCILLTADRDLVQLVNFNKNSYTVMFSPVHSDLYTGHGFSTWLEESDSGSDDIFEIMKNSTDGDTRTKKLFKDLILSKKLSIKQIDSEEFRLRKVLTGDKGDNIMSAYWYNTPKRQIGIGNKGADKIVSAYKERIGKLNYLDLYEDDYVKDLANVLIKEINADKMPREKIIANIKNNVALMILSDKSIPNEILNSMYSDIETKIDESNINLKELGDSKLLISNVGYEKKSSSFVSSVFEKDSNDNSDFSFIKKG